MSILKFNVVVAWLLLIALTLMSWYLSGGLSLEYKNANQFTTSVLFLFAFFKVRLIIIYFMGVGAAPLILRLLFEVWVLVMCAILIAMYWLLPV